MTGIFRIPGSFSTIKTIVNHYNEQIESAEKAPEYIQENVSLALLPPNVSYDVHDVASAFKKLLTSVPGGILGSRWLFEALRDISGHPVNGRSYSEPQAEDSRNRLIALTIARSGSVYRVHLICAVFGLLSLIGSEAEAARIALAERRESQSSEKMGYEALSVVFGPLLIGDMINDITLPPSEPIIPNIKTRSNHGATTAVSQQQARIAQVQATLALQLGQTAIAVQITKMLISSWEGVAAELRMAGLLGFDQGPPRPPSSVGVEEVTPEPASTTKPVARPHLGRSRSVSDILRSIERATAMGKPRRIVFSYPAVGPQPSGDAQQDHSSSKVDAEVIKASGVISRKRVSKFASERQNSPRHEMGPLPDTKRVRARHSAATFQSITPFAIPPRRSSYAQGMEAPGVKAEVPKTEVPNGTPDRVIAREVHSSGSSKQDIHPVQPRHESTSRRLQHRLSLFLRRSQ